MASERFLLRDRSCLVSDRIPLPPYRCVELKPDVATERFLVRLAQVALESAAWTIAEWNRASTGYLSLALDYQGDTSTSKKGLKLIVFFIPDECGSRLNLLWLFRRICGREMVSERPGVGGVEGAASRWAMRWPRSGRARELMVGSGRGE